MLRLWCEDKFGGRMKLTVTEDIDKTAEHPIKGMGQLVFTSYSVDATRTPLMIGDILDEHVIARTPWGEILKLPRHCVEVPILACMGCGKHAILRDGKQHDTAECPDHARHMYESLLQMSHDKSHSRQQSRKIHKEAHKWLRRWRRQFEVRQKRTEDKAKMTQGKATRPIDIDKMPQGSNSHVTEPVFRG
jgi:hypothetical protein